MTLWAPRISAGSRARRRAAAGLLPLLCLLAVSALAPVTAEAGPQEVTRAAKVRLLKHFSSVYHTAPQLLVLGSSRAMRADPRVLRKLLGLKGFNASVSSGSIPDAYAFYALTRHVYPRSRPAVLWFLDVEALRLGGYHPYLLSVPSLRRWLPKLPVPAARVSAQALAGGATPGGGVVRPRWHPDGLLTYWWHDWQRARGRTTRAAVRWHMGTYGSIYKAGYRSLNGRAKWFVTRIVSEANAMGVTPVIVLTPYHPRLRAHLAGLGWQKAYRLVRRFLRRLDARHQIKLLDLTYLRSFRGWPQGFYDGVHPRAAMMRRILTTIASRAGGLLRPPEASPSPEDSPSPVVTQPAATKPSSGSLRRFRAGASAGVFAAAVSLPAPPAGNVPERDPARGGTVALGVLSCGIALVLVLASRRRSAAAGRPGPGRPSVGRPGV